ncbi:uncharacterized protein LACBIDRAFT_309779 [Laccaria bicolor S238N-H82]|uniref:Predicted protein n=1 Tax=Laccaria bicolor (strain S238N-H82 / ATCC MYA-4686) TaxID=486041 RepID=B0DT22_LACBS|nr:uncharacterized protein LACBIDRAFT_309779 [Laccaria bicolor S238N-H82]EDR02340.1 predicted protein [Laccaria bicolor S238N-H82]|eukprot:XP_001887017.1 predicted protein [Laccaria bicolor S238N-H82]
MSTGCTEIQAYSLGTHPFAHSFCSMKLTDHGQRQPTFAVPQTLPLHQQHAYLSGGRWLVTEMDDGLDEVPAIHEPIVRIQSASTRSRSCLAPYNDPLKSPSS